MKCEVVEVNISSVTDILHPSANFTLARQAYSIWSGIAVASAGANFFFALIIIITQMCISIVLFFINRHLRIFALIWTVNTLLINFQ